MDVTVITTQTNGRKLWGLGPILLLSLSLNQNLASSAAEDDGITSLTEIMPGKPWPERRREIERRWLELMGDFPMAMPELDWRIAQ